MHLPFSSGSILSSVDIQAPDLRAITDQMEDRSKKFHQFKGWKSPVTCLEPCPQVLDAVAIGNPTINVFF